MQSGHLADIITRNQVFLERLKAGEIRNFAKPLDAVARRVRQIMSAIESDTLDKLTKKELNRILSELRQAHASIMGEAMLDQFGRFGEIAEQQAGFEAAALTAAAVDKLRLTAATAESAYRAAYGRPLAVNGDLLEPFLTGWVKDDADRIAGAVRRGWAEGRTVQQVTRDIVGTKAQNLRDGLLWKTKRKVETIVRTSTQHVANTARMQTWAENSDLVTGYQWLSTLDNRTSQQCRSLDGQVFEIGKGPVPPIHPNCRSTTIAELSNDFDFLDEGGTRSSSGGYVSQDLSYYDWLKKQPKAFQVEAMGPTRTELFRQGGLSADEFAKLNLGRNFEPLTLSQMRKLDPVAFEKAGL